MLPVCGGMYNMDKIVKLQMRALRYICNVGFLDPTSGLYERGNILTVAEFYEKSLVRQYCRVPAMTRPDHEHVTRCSTAGNLTIQVARFEFSRRSLLNNCIVLYNS